MFFKTIGRTLALVMFPLLCFSQEVSTSEDRTAFFEVLSNLEQSSGYDFFYLEEWLRDIKVLELSATPDLSELAEPDRAKAVQEFLEELFASTALNFYIDTEMKRVYLLRNTLIYDELPAGYFGPETDSTVSQTITSRPANAPPPVFLDDGARQRTRNLGIARIGKAEAGNPGDSYTLSGRALRSDNGEPIPDLALRVRELGIGTVTDAQGNYQLQLPRGFYVISATAMGVASLERQVVIYGDGTLDLELEEGIELLDEVVVEADAAANVEEATSGTETIESEASKNIPLVLGERDILQVARNLPGISSAGEGAGGFNVRGGRTDQNLILLDDGVIYNPTHFFGIFQALNPFTTDRLDIYKAAPPVEYGGRLSSIFDIRSTNGNNQEISGEGSIGPVTANLALEVPLKKERSSMVVGMRGAYADWILRSLDDEDLQNSQASFFDGILRVHSLVGEEGAVGATGYFSRDAFSITQDSLYQYSNALLSVRWDHKIGAETRGTLVAGNSDYRFGIDFDGESNTDFELDYGINQTQLKYFLQRPLGDKHRLTYGIASYFYTVNPGSREPQGSDNALAPIEIPREQALEGALFVGDRWRPNDKWEWELGLRFPFYTALGETTQREYNEGEPRGDASVSGINEYGSLEPVRWYGGPEARLAGRYSLTPESSIKFSLHNSYQFIHTLSNNTTISPIDTWKLSDLNITPQQAYQGSLGYFRNFNDNMYEFSVEGYYKWMVDVLDFKTGSQLFLNENVETEVLQGDGQAYGVEVLLKKNKGKLNGWLGYTYSRSLYRFDGEFEEERINDGEFFPSNFDKPHDVSLIANYRFTRRYSVSMNFVYQTGRPVTYPVGTFRLNNTDYVFYSERNAFRIPDFYRLDLGINIEGNHKKNKLAHSFWTISVYNVLGRNNPYSVFFVSEGGEVKALQSSIFAIPVPSITYNFKF